MARSTESRRRHPLASQRGDALVEALIAMILLGVIGLGLVYALSRAMVAQKYQKGQSLAIQGIRADLQNAGVANGCPAAGASTVSSNLSLGSNLQVTGVQKTCTITAVTVTLNGVAKSASLPVVQYAADAETLFGPGTLTVSN
ncbi:type II secretion system GspH family protein [Paucibacter sp. DJ1R-11]|uniref:type II secretion system protein n=1 Tax=Paucibacter sp. DJ1R-11 TaxID=2893556 RepID=UPI0021E4DFE7|nr:type II secretion system protein [Paucibacter sp. DJ1R-11]MCV2366031.1 type II secretion system GspH family protein [Paucibacter sp. DJ1R-11]